MGESRLCNFCVRMNLRLILSILFLFDCFLSIALTSSDKSLTVTVDSNLLSFSSVMDLLAHPVNLVAVLNPIFVLALFGILGLAALSRSNEFLMLLKDENVSNRFTDYNYGQFEEENDSGWTI